MRKERSDSILFFHFRLTSYLQSVISPVSCQPAVDESAESTLSIGIFPLLSSCRQHGHRPRADGEAGSLRPRPLPPLGAARRRGPRLGHPAGPGRVRSAAVAGEEQHGDPLWVSGAGAHRLPTPYTTAYPHLPTAYPPPTRRLTQDPKRADQPRMQFNPERDIAVPPECDMDLCARALLRFALFLNHFCSHFSSISHTCILLWLYACCADGFVVPPRPIIGTATPT